MPTLNQQQINQALKLPRLFNGIMSIGLIAIIILCQTFSDQLVTAISEENRILIRTLLYWIGIVFFPITNLIRHIQLRLNATMPASTENYLAVAKRRYMVTVLVSLSLIDSLGFFGFVMYLLGDSLNTLYIFVAMSALGLFLYRPKANEFIEIFNGLSGQIRS